MLELNYSADPSLAYVHSASSAEGCGNQSSHVLGGWWREIRGYSFEQYTLCNMVLCVNHICSLIPLENAVALPNSSLIPRLFWSGNETSQFVQLK